VPTRVPEEAPRRAAPFSRSHEWAVIALCLVAGLFFFASLGNLWPLADADLVLPAERVQARGRAFLESIGFDLTGYRSASRIVVDKAALNYLETGFGRQRTQEWIAGGLPLVYYRASYKKRGETIGYSVDLHPGLAVLGWNKQVQDDYPGPRVPEAEARDTARLALVDALGLRADEFEERSASTTEHVERTTHTFGFERLLSETPELRERVSIAVVGEEVLHGRRYLVVPEPARREARTREAPGIAMETVGFALLAVSAIAALFVFLRRLRDGSARLGRIVVWPALVLVCLLGTFALETASLFGYWEPLWPRWVSGLRYLVFRAIEQVWILLVLFAIVAAADALDRESGSGRGASLSALGRGRLLDPSVVLASGRGFLIGLLCGGVMAGAVTALQWVAGAETSIQPRGFFFYTLNSASPALTSLLFFFAVALGEELGYRFFGGTWLFALTRRKWLAILVPGLIYGLAHTRLDFLPPAEPFWARALVLTLVGCVWGWAFFRYDALTVVLSHFTADLFIFNWPRIASGQPGPVAISAAIVCVPLLPAALGWLARGLTGFGSRGPR